MNYELSVLISLWNNEIELWHVLHALPGPRVSNWSSVKVQKPLPDSDPLASVDWELGTPNVTVQGDLGLIGEGGVLRPDPQFTPVSYQDELGVQLQGCK